MGIIHVRAAPGRRAFAAVHGDELTAEFRPYPETPFLRRQIETGDAEERSEAKSVAPAAQIASVFPAKTEPRENAENTGAKHNRAVTPATKKED